MRTSRHFVLAAALLAAACATPPPASAPTRNAAKGPGLGVAMTPAVIRDGKIKSHMLFNAGILLPLEDEKNEFYEQALHTLAHECAHVEVTARFDTAANSSARPTTRRRSRRDCLFLPELSMW